MAFADLIRNATFSPQTLADLLDELHELLTPTTQTYTPTFAGASGSYSSVVPTTNIFSRLGDIVKYQVDGVGTLNTTSAYLVVSLPFDSTEADFATMGLGQIRRNGSANWEPAQVAKHSSSENLIRVIPINGTSITNSTGVGVRALGMFKSVAL